MCSVDAIVHSRLSRLVKRGRCGKVNWILDRDFVTGVVVPKRYEHLFQRFGQVHTIFIQVKYVDEKGEVVYIHEFDGHAWTCSRYEDVLIPMMWLVQHHPPFGQKVVKELRNGYALDNAISPFLQWVMQTKDGLPNIYRVLLQIYK